MTAENKTSLKGQIFKNMASNYAMTGAGLLLGILLVPFMIHKLGTESFGLVSMVESLVLLYEMVTVSVRQALSRYATFALSAGRREEFTEYLSTGRVLMFGSSVVVMTVGVAVSLFFTSLFRVPDGQGVQAQWLFFFMTLAFAASIPNSVFWAVLYAHQRFDLINSASSIAMIVRAVALFCWFSFAPAQWAGLTAYGVIYCIVVLADNMVVYFWHFKIMPGLRIGLSSFRRERVRDIVSYSVHTSIARLSTILVSNTVQICMNVLWGPSMNAFYAVAQKIPIYLRRIFVEPIWTLTPTFTKLVAENDQIRVERLFFSSSKILSIVTIPICLACLFLGDTIIHLWVGPGFEMSASLMKLFVIPMIFSMQLTVAGCLNSAHGKVKVPSLTGIVAAVVNAGSGFLLATVWKMGLFGFAWANLVVSLLYTTFFAGVYTCRISNISARKYFIETVAGPFFLSMVLWGGFFFGWKYFATGKEFSPAFLIETFVLTAVYTWICARFLLSPDERRLVREAVSGATIFLKKGISHEA